MANVFNYSVDYTQLRDGDIDPTLNKRIKSLIIHTDDHIVYVDEDETVQWSIKNFSDPTAKFGEVVARVGKLEARSEFMRGTGHLEFSRRMIAEGAARIIDDKDYDLSMRTLDEAEKYIDSRNREFSRKWYFETAFITTVFCMLGPVKQIV